MTKSMSGRFASASICSQYMRTADRWTYLVCVDRCWDEKTNGNPAGEVALNGCAATYPQDQARFGFHWQV